MQFKRLLAALIILAGVAFGQIQASAQQAVEKAHNASYHIVQSTLAGNSVCSATAIGPQALLTATHCELPSDDLGLAGQEVQTDVVIVDRVRDSLDHTIYFIKGATFPVYVDVIQQKPGLAEEVFSFGNPGDLDDIYSKGYVAGIKYDHSLAASFGHADPPEILFNLLVYEGNSGSGVFNMGGDLIAVESVCEIQKKDGLSTSFAGAHPLYFKKAELARAKTFTTPPEPKNDKAPPTAKQ